MSIEAAMTEKVKEELERIEREAFQEEIKAQELAKTGVEVSLELLEKERAAKMYELEQANLLSEIKAMIGVGDK